MFESHLYGYLSTGNEFHRVMVIDIGFMLVDIMFECHLYHSPVLVMNSIV